MSAPIGKPTQASAVGRPDLPDEDRAEAPRPDRPRAVEPAPAAPAAPAAPVAEAKAEASKPAAPRPGTAKPVVRSPAKPAAAAGADADKTPELTRAEQQAKAARREIRAARRAAREQASLQPVRPPAAKASMKARHYGMIASFLLVVIVPVIVSGWYLYNRAADQYASFVGFSVRSESAPGASEILGGLGSLVGVTANSTSDTDILYKFIHSRDLVERVNNRLDLREIWSKAPDDPIFRFRGGTTLEHLAREWDRKVNIHYDTGMIDFRILAFDPVDAQAIAQAVLDESGILINELNDIAREDALRYARDEMERAHDRLREARQAVAEFRNTHQLIDPSADVQGQMGVVTSLQAQLAEQLVSLGLLRANAQPGDQRIAQTELRISVIREQMEAERQNFSSGSAVALSDVVGQYEVLAVDRQFAETTYTAAMASYESARAEAMRQSRYLAAYIRPTLAQDAEFPKRAQLMVMIFGFALALWMIGTLIFYSLRDRR